ncbi:tetratricopeptide repeat protein [Bacillus sp. Marseille-P3661]|uniref:tetratricopeptide repeat protein n=1 Tax=Bacillus sp. Marseille-P3661 TaxID=1936234 RepID=UPI000C81585A|nr:tetratricopeptide repeat protein [Bacillus sp. Marseille-P3661]
MFEKLEKAIKLVENGDISEGINYLHSLKQIANHEEKIMIADLYLKWGFLDEAKEIVIELLELYPDEGQLYIYAAEIEIEQENEVEALDYLDEIKESDPAYLQSLVIMADLFQMQGLDEAAEQKLLKAKVLAPDEILIDLGLGQFYADIGEYKKAIPFLNKVIERKEEVDSNAHLLLADAYVHIGKFEDAFVHYEEGLKDNIELNALFNLAFTAFQLERYEYAIGKWNELKELDPEYIPIYLYLAKAYEHEGVVEESYNIIKQGLQIDPDNKELLVYGGKMAMKLKKHDEVERYLSKAIEIDPGYIDALSLLSSFYLYNEQYEEIILLLEKAIADGEYDPQFEWDLANAKKQLDLYKEALNHYENAYTSFKDSKEFLEEYGYFLLEEGDREKAKAMFRKILEIDPANIEIEEELMRLEQW